MSTTNKQKNDLEQRKMEREAFLLNREIEKETKSKSDYNLRRGNNNSDNKLNNNTKTRNQPRSPSKNSREGGIMNIGSTSRRAGEKPSAEDLSDVIFSKSNKFSSGETVLVLRSRGGFVYGQVKASKAMKNCYNDPTAHHPYIEYRISYRNSQGNEMYKDLPGAFIGKLLPTPSLTSSLALADNFRKLGERATNKDLNNVTLDPRHSFVAGEVVLVARSTGGFSYGEVVSSIKMSCGQSNETTHKILAFRVCIDADKKMRKDLPPGSIGKLPISESVSLPSLPSSLNQHNQINNNNNNNNNKNNKNNNNSNGNIHSNSNNDLNNNNIDIDIEDEIICWDPKAFYGDQNDDDNNNQNEDQMRKNNDNNNNNNNNDNDDNNQSFNFDFDAAIGAEEPDNQKEEISIVNEKKITSFIDISKHNVNPNVISLKNDIPRTSVIKFDKPPSSASSSPFDNMRKSDRKCLVVLDIPNIAKKHGKQGKFSTKGVKICIDYWQNLGHEVIGFLPEHYLSKKPNSTSQVTLSEYFENQSKVDNLPLVQQYVDEGLIAVTPPQDYDDSYCIRYAKDNGGVIVTNDMYRDHIEKQEEKNKVYRWMKEHLISFTFVKDSFIPNPDFVFPSQRSNNRKRS